MDSDVVIALGLLHLTRVGELEEGEDSCCGKERGVEKRAYTYTARDKLVSRSA